MSWGVVRLLTVLCVNGWRRWLAVPIMSAESAFGKGPASSSHLCRFLRRLCHICGVAYARMNLLALRQKTLELQVLQDGLAVAGLALSGVLDDRVDLSEILDVVFLDKFA